MLTGNRLRRLLVLGLCLLGWPSVRADNALARREWTVDGVVRQALVSEMESDKMKAAPVVFVFHGHGGNMGQAAKSFAIHLLWPEVIVVYPQGLPTPSALVDPEGKKSGWQHAAGGQDDRDLKFFDAMLATLRKDYRVDDKRIYVTGHSNGVYFTYLLWAMRGGQLAAVAPSAACVGAALAVLKPKPVLHVAGAKDPLVKFAWQMATVDTVRKLNQCGEGQPWEEQPGCTLYPSKRGAPVVTCIHPGGHVFPPAAPALIVKFFKEHALP